MDITGKIILALPEVTGTSQRGNAWKKREYVLETQETYPKKVFFDFFGEKADQFPLQVGQMIRLYFDIESREYQGRWYTSIRAWKYEDANMPPAGPMQQPTDPMGYPGAPAPPYPGAPAPAPVYPGAPAPAQTYPGSVPPPPMTPSQPTDDLPF